MVYLKLALSILLEVIGTSLMSKTDGFRNLPYTIVLLLCYSLAFYLISGVVKTLPVGIVYATWSASGIVLISLVGYFFYNQVLDLAGMLGIGMIVAGVIVVNVFSKTAVH